MSELKTPLKVEFMGTPHCYIVDADGYTIATYVPAAEAAELVRRANLFERLVAMLKAMQAPGPVFGCSMCQKRDGCDHDCELAALLRDCESEEANA